jgi:hypothetical protein
VLDRAELATMSAEEGVGSSWLAVPVPAAIENDVRQYRRTPGPAAGISCEGARQLSFRSRRDSGVTPI